DLKNGKDDNLKQAISRSVGLTEYKLNPNKAVNEVVLINSMVVMKKNQKSSCDSRADGAE
ncbi:25423_t:CDS:2, partial [Racocetra persica]